MAGLTETEIFAKYVQSLKEARDQCVWLNTQQDPDLIGPRGWRYGKLRTALNELEGCCRQIAHFRSDTRWVRLGVVYARAMRTVQAKYIGQDWAAFGKLTELFDRGLRDMEELRNRRVGRRGAILPTQPTDWLVLPDWKPPQRMFVPTGRA
jgi:hypothetical protein